jgi:Papain-like cysteine protease AvrRpt2
MHRRPCGRGLALLMAARVLLAADSVCAQELERPLDVPYVAQSEALCGGAAAAMVLRYWGERGVDAETFSPLLNSEHDGIETHVLVNALVERGWRALAYTGTIASVSHHVGRQRPVIVLLRIAPGRFHYVVVVQINALDVVYHDPAGRPSQTMSLAGFDGAWSASSRWALLALPRQVPSRSETVVARPAPPLPAACLPVLTQAADAANRHQYDMAEQLVNAAQIACPSDAAPLRELAGLRLLQRRSTDAVILARAAVALDPADGHAWRVLGTAEFLQRNQIAALRAWNRAGEPLTDLVQVDGLVRTRHRVVTDRMSLVPGEVLTPWGLARARRRLAELPAAGASRVEVRPVGGGLAEVDAAVVERPLTPTSRLALGALAARAAVNREVAWQVASPTGSGERFDVAARWWQARPAVAVALTVPLESRVIDGIVKLEGSFSRESFLRRSPSIDSIVEDRRGAAVSLSDWATANVRWDATVRVDRWTDRGMLLGVGSALERRAGEQAAVRLQGDVWPAGGFGAASLGARWRWTRDGADQLLASLTAGLASQKAPRALWSGAGTGHGRRLLLRAHPLLDDGVIAGEAFGRRLVHGSVEWRQRLAAIGPLLLQAAVFADAAAASRADRSASRHVDIGVGVRVRVPGEGTLRVDYGRGLTDVRHAVSVGWDLPWPSWP